MYVCPSRFWNALNFFGKDRCKPCCQTKIWQANMRGGRTFMLMKQRDSEAALEE